LFFEKVAKDAEAVGEEEEEKKEERFILDGQDGKRDLEISMFQNKK